MYVYVPVSKIWAGEGGGGLRSCNDQLPRVLWSTEY